MSETHEELKSAQKEAETYIKQHCKNAWNLWSNKLENVDMDTWFVDIQLRIIDDNCPNQGVLVDGYKTLFEDSEKNQCRQTIFITGEAGCGKSMYVNKLAFNWANGDPYLRNKFDLVLLYDFPSWKTAIKEGLQYTFSQKLHPSVKTLLDTSDKVLIICDISAQKSETEEWNLVNTILKHEYYPNVTAIVTTQALCFWEISVQYVWIDGFSESSVREYLNIQNCPPTDNDIMTDLLQLPLFCALYCILHKQGCSTDLIVDPFDLIKRYVESTTLQKYFDSFGNKFSGKTVAETLMIIGKYCFVHLVDVSGFETLNDLNLSIMENSYDCESLHGRHLDCGLLIKKQNSPDYQVLHQSIADYLAAYYIANVVNMELHFPQSFYATFETPLIEYLFHHVLWLWHEGQFSDKSLSKVLEYGSTFHQWFCKRESFFTQFSDRFNAVTNINVDNWSVGKNINFFKNLWKCKNLERLTLHCCNISHNSANALADVLNSGQLPHLANIMINEDITIGNETKLFESLGSLENLEYLQLSNCHLTTDSVKAFTNQMNLGKLKGVRHLVFPVNWEIGREPTFFSALAKCPNLTSIDLRFCNISKESVNSFASAIVSSGFQNLDAINFNDSKEVGSCIELFANLSKLPMLTTLYVSNCDISDTCLQKMANDMMEKKFIMLKILIVSCNPNIGKNVSYINALTHCQSLEYLAISKCNLTPESIDSLNVLRNKECEVADTDDNE